MIPINIQPIEKSTTGSLGLQLDVHSIFHTIQGEGPFCGTPAVFIRLAGCNLQCPGCDTDYTTDRKMMPFEDIVKEVRKYKCPFIVITGGEPFRQQLSFLIRSLLEEDYYIQIETNGTLEVNCDIRLNTDIDTRMGVYIVCSPKTGKVHQSILDNACAYKYVLENGCVDDVDGLPIFALQHSCRPRVQRINLENYDWPPLIYVQPMDSKDPIQNDRNLKAAIKSCMLYNYILQIQTHKIIGVE